MLSEFERNEAIVEFVEYANASYEANECIAEELAARVCDEQVYEDLLNEAALEELSDGLGGQIVNVTITVASQMLVQRLFGAIVDVVVGDVVDSWGRKLQGGKRPKAIYKMLDSSIEELAEGLPW